MKTKYVRIQPFEREEISRGLAAGWTFSHIAVNINRPVSTVSREVKNNCKYKRCYRAEAAGNKAQGIRHRQKQPKILEADQRLRDYIIENLRLKWSPEEIAKRLKLAYPLDMTMRASYETIYTYLYCLP